MRLDSRSGDVGRKGLVWLALGATLATACSNAAPADGEFDDESEVIGPLPTPPRTTAPAVAGQATPQGWSGSPTPPSLGSDGGVTQGDTPQGGAPPVLPPGSSGPGGPAGPAPTNADPYALARDFCAQRINQYRATLGRAQLTRVPLAEYCTDRQAVNDAQLMQAHGSFSSCNELAQNECPGWPGPLSNVLPSCLDSMWREGPGGGHYENMASAQYQYVACGFHLAPNGSWWIIQNFR